MALSIRKYCIFGVVAGALGVGGTAFAQDSGRVQELKKIAAEMKPFSLRAIGLPVAASEWGFLEKPFWTDKVKELSGGKVTVQLNSMTEVNLQGGEVFKLTSTGTFDVADIVANYGAGDLTQLDGLDLAGVAGTFEEEDKVITAYAPSIHKALKERFNLVTLGQAHSTAQVFFCRNDIKSVEDLRGKKVRLTSSTLADVVRGLGGAPITMSIAEAVPAVQRGVLDCMITGTMSGNTAKFYEVTTHLFALPVGWAPRLRIINGRTWDRLDEQQRRWLQLATDYYFREMSDPIEVRNTNEGIWCSGGDSRCTLDGQFGVKKANMAVVTPSEADRKTLKAVVEKSVLPAFAKACGPACTADWNATVGKTMGLEAKP